MSEGKFIGTLIVEGVYDFGATHLAPRRRCRTGETFVFSADEVEHIRRDSFDRFTFEEYTGPREVGYKFANGEPRHLPEEPPAEPVPEATGALAPA